MLTRLETMVLMGAEMPLYAIRAQIASALDVMVHLGRFRDGSRKVVEITEVCGFDGNVIRLAPLYIFHPESGRLEATGNQIRNRKNSQWGGKK